MQRKPTGKEIAWRAVLVALAPVHTVLLVAVLEATGLAPPGATERLVALLVRLLAVLPARAVL